MDLLEEDILSDHELKIDEEISGYLIETSKWAKIIVKIIYIVLVVLILLSFYFGFAGLAAIATPIYKIIGKGSLIITAFLITIAIVGFVAFYFLLNFSRRISEGVKLKNIRSINQGLKSLKAHFTIIGIILGGKLLFTIYQMVVK